jgi:hypothetical protein
VVPPRRDAVKVVANGVPEPLGSHN